MAEAPVTKIAVLGAGSWGTTFAKVMADAARAAIRCENPPRRSGMSISVPFSSEGPEITAECRKFRCPNRHGFDPRHSRCSWMEAPIRFSASVNPNRFS